MSPTLLHYKHRVENEVAVQMRAEEDYRSCRQLLQAGWAPLMTSRMKVCTASCPVSQSGWANLALLDRGFAILY